MSRPIFYAWQATLPSLTTREFIHSALLDACTVLGRGLSVDARPEVDHDTRGVPGAPDIANAIRTKIDGAEAFVADVSIVRGGTHPFPNPNVVYELGYAEKSLGSDRILLVMNLAHGGPELLPFDIRSKRVTTYRADEQADFAQEGAHLRRALQDGLADVLRQPAKATVELARALNVVHLEAERMRDHARDLNIELHHGRSRQYLPLRFRTSQLEAVIPLIADLLRRHDALKHVFTDLRITAAAADEETDRLLARGGNSTHLRQLVINVNHAAAGVLRSLDRVLEMN